jgi:hypothetical protein
VVFGGLLVQSKKSIPTFGTSFSVERNGAKYGFRLCDGAGAGSAGRFTDADGLLFDLDKCLTIALQLQRPDLYFLHAAAVASAGRVAVLAAPTGTGKSTLTMALLERGFSYLSDELAPIDISTLRVYPYAHAVCLKSRPPEPLQIPPGTIAIGKRFHVASGLLDAAAADEPLPLAAFIFLRRSSGSVTSRRMGPAAGAAHLLANTLNALAHESSGLNVAINLAQSVPSFEIDVSDVTAACAAVEAILTAGP